MEVLVVLNPVAGRTQADHVKEALRRHFDHALAYRLTIYETTGHDDVAEVVREALEKGVDRIFAAGGDGTVSAVVDALVHSDIPLGIIPTGTTNVLAQELGIPLNVEKACRLLADKPAVRAIDALQLRGKYYILSIGTGLDALAMEETSREGKRRLGRLAYIRSILKVVMGAQPHTFTIIADGQRRKIRAADVLMTNVSTLTRPFRWGPHIQPDDGRIDICIMRARNFKDIIGVAFDILVPGRPRKERNLIYWHAHHTILVFAEQPLPVQGDGESLGQTPLEIYVVPGAVQVFVPDDSQNNRWLRLPSLPINKG